ncbi:hypothetical protein PsdCFBP2356_22935 [Pseudomonas syringae pv. dysoxyli]|uniref:hypothetical protein n=1 Tax=Pseudomonas syringae TaxID=317 RepID=UPI001372A364|nr:hypothetical protein [Pseudomonas syringae]NAO29347.1 hypothetical protein [Pseudomonas syringae pv. dysoxyli]
MDVEVIKARPCASPEEEVVIALHPPRWDPTLKRGTKSIFAKPNTSVSRRVVSSIEDIVASFRRSIQGGSVDLKGYGVIGVDALQAIGAESPSPIAFEVTVDPVNPTREDPVGNAAHAEIIPFTPDKASIKTRVSDGVCSKLEKALIVVQVD